MAERLDFARLQSDRDQERLRFLRNEVAIGLTFCAVAETERRAGDFTGGARALDGARKAYETALRFLRDPRHASRLPEDDRLKIVSGLEQLRARITTLKR